MPFPQRLCYLWNDHPGPVVAGLVLVTSLGAGAGGWMAHDQPTQPAPLPVSRPVAAPTVVEPAAVAPAVDAGLLQARTQERDAALQRVEQLEALLDAAGAPLADAPATAPAEQATALEGTAPADEPSADEPEAAQPGAAAGACDTAVGLFSDHDRDLGGVIGGDNDARRTGHSLGNDIVAMRTLSADVGQPLSGLIGAYADVIFGVRAHLLQHGGLDGWQHAPFYATGNALKDHCAAASDPLA